MRPKLCLATNNPHKAEELQAIVGGLFDLTPASALVPRPTWEETGATFEANARIKAETLARLWPGPVLADDSGLAVDALGGAPGVYSSRYAGRDGDDVANNAKLLAALEGVPAARRGAHFVCVLYYLDEQQRAHTFRGELPGRIATAARGGHGFGYDPLFEVEGQDGRTLAELDAAAKNALSHRRRAVDAWLAFVRAAR